MAAAVARADLEDMGLEVTEHEGAPGRPSLIARCGSGRPVLGYCSHLDVVPAGDRADWDEDPYGARVKDGRLYGRGSGDAKGPIAAALEAVAAIIEGGVPLAGTLELELVADEEAMGFKGAGELVARGVMAPDLAIVGEPTSLRVVRAQRGASWFRLTTRGRAAHGSAPERGVSAIAHMAAVIEHLPDTLPVIDHPLLGGPTLSVGTISGGVKVNVVPASCTIEIDRRTVPGESAESVRASIEEAVELARARYPDLRVDVDVPVHCKPFEIPASAPVVTAMAAAVAEATGSPGELAGFRGASDARFLFEAGAEVIVCGPGDISVAHTADEHMELDELERGAVAYALAFTSLLASGGAG